MKIQHKLSIHGGNFARPTKFTVMVNRPTSITSGDESSLDIMCKTINIPDTVHVPIDLVYKGHNVKIPGRTNQTQEVSMTFYLDERYNTRRLFQEWIDILDPHYYAGSDVPPNNEGKYGSITVIARDFGESTDEIERFTFENVYPTNLSSLEYSTTDKDQIMEFTVTFTYYRVLNRDDGVLDIFDLWDLFTTPHKPKKSNIDFKKHDNIISPTRQGGLPWPQK